MESMTKLAGDPQVVVRARYDWQRFLANRIIYGGRYDWHTVEGPCVQKHNGSYFCSFSSGRWENDTYGVDYAIADSVQGTYSHQPSAEGASLLRSIPGQLIGPGHNSVIRESSTQSDLIVFHAWNTDVSKRQTYVTPLAWTEDGPRCSSE
jgi:GH43 family beta-xylosidase